MSKYEKLQANIPGGSKWDLNAVDGRAKELGLDRSELIIKAVDLMMNFDNDFLEYIKYYAEGLKIPEYLVIQNMVITRMADEEAQKEVHGKLTGFVEGFMSTIDDKGPRQITGKELKNILKDLKVREYKKELAEIQARIDFYIKGQQKLD